MDLDETPIPPQKETEKPVSVIPLPVESIAIDNITIPLNKTENPPANSENSQAPPPPDAPTEPPKIKRGEGAEAKRVANRLKGFDPKNSQVYQILVSKFSSGVTHSELKSIAQICCKFCKNLTLDRDASRDNRVLIKWFEENWSIIQTIINDIHLRDDNEKIINLEREQEKKAPNVK